MLITKKIEAAKGEDKPYKMYDQHGLYLYVSTTGSKSWRAKYTLGGKSKTKTFGRFPEVSLAKARLLNSEFKEKLSSSGFKKVPTFAMVLEEYMQLRKAKMKEGPHHERVENRIKTYALPYIGSKPVNEITRAELVKIAKDSQQLDTRKTISTAHRVAMYLRAVFDLAVDSGYIESHPASGLSRVLLPETPTHMACIHPSKAPKLFKDIMNYPDPVTRIGLMLLALTFVRTNELRYFEKSEIKDKRFWVVPETRTKGKKGLSKPHVVPLSDWVLELIEEVDQYTGEYKYVLNSLTKSDKPISENTMLYALYNMGYRKEMTGHGFRALASTVLNEQSPFDKDVIERQLAHKESDAVRAAYNRAEYLDERIKLMDWWSDWVKHALLSPETT